VENDSQESATKLAQAHDVSAKTVHTILHKHMMFSMKSARWLPNLMDKEMKKEQVRMCKVVAAMAAMVP
jgi:hypothetical protein